MTKRGEVYAGYTKDETPKPATRAQMAALRDHLLALGLYSSAAAVDNAIDCIQRDNAIAERLASMREQFAEYETEISEPSQDAHDPTTTEIALNVARYNVEHATPNNLEWARARLAEEEAKARNSGGTG